MIECQVTHGCGVDITMRHNGNVDILRFCFCFHCNLQPNCTCGGTLSIGPAHHNDSHGMNAIMIAQPLPIPSSIPFNSLSYSVM